MADNVFPSLVSKSRDVNANTNPIWVELSDGTSALSVTGGKLDVNASFVGTVTLGSQFNVDTAAGATDAGENVLAVRTDTLATLTPVNGDYVSLHTDSKGALWVDIANASIAVTGTVAVSGVSGTVTVSQNALTLATDAVKISGNSTANSLLNPIYVQQVKVSNEANEIHNYNTATPSGDAASNHDYTVTGTTFLLESVIVSCSGAMKAEIQTGPVGSLATKAVVFLNARQGDTKQVFFDPPIEVPVTSTGTVRVIRTNRNSSATDVYSTIIGNDVA
jgi:hypothetical protein